jgi:hypothetical protein
VPAASTQRLQRLAEGHRQAMSLGNMRGGGRSGTGRGNGDAVFWASTSRCSGARPMAAFFATLDLNFEVGDRPRLSERGLHAIG